MDMNYFKTTIRRVYVNSSKSKFLGDLVCRLIRERQYVRLMAKDMDSQ